MATPQRRQRAANLVGDDYPTLIASLPGVGGTRAVFDPVSMVLTSVEGAAVSQWSYATQALQRRDDWVMTALEVVPLVRRVVMDRSGSVSRIGLTLNISHARLSDLRIKLIAPSGRAVEVETGLERASSGDDIRIAPQQLRDMIGETAHRDLVDQRSRRESRHRRTVCRLESEVEFAGQHRGFSARPEHS